MNNKCIKEISELKNNMYKLEISELLSRSYNLSMRLGDKDKQLFFKKEIEGYLIGDHLPSYRKIRTINAKLRLKTAMPAGFGRIYSQGHIIEFPNKNNIDINKKFNNIVIHYREPIDRVIYLSCGDGELCMPTNEIVQLNNEHFGSFEAEVVLIIDRLDMQMITNRIKIETHNWIHNISSDINEITLEKYEYNDKNKSIYKFIDVSGWSLFNGSFSTWFNNNKFSTYFKPTIFKITISFVLICFIFYCIKQSM